MTRESAGWVYAVVSDQVGEVPPDATTWTGEPVRLVRGSGLAAVVGSLPPDLTGEEQLQEHLCDPAWLERTIRAHHHVVTSFFRRTPTVPFRMGTVCRGDDRVRDLLAAQADGLRAALATVAGRAEWGVQVYPGPAAGETAAAAGPAPAAAGARAADPARPGTAYLLRRRAERQRREQVRAAAATAARELDHALAALAVAVHRPAPAVGGGSQATPLFQASYLVDQDRSGEFVAQVRRLDERLSQVRLRVTGPWPAYSFVTLTEEAVG